MQTFFVATLAALAGIAVATSTVGAPVKPDKPAPKLASPMVYIDMGCLPAEDEETPPHCGMGSGVDIGHGFILTAAHVANSTEGFKEEDLKVKDSLGREHATELLWANHTYDVALLRVGDPDTIAGAHLSGRLLRQGEKLSFQGNPFDIQDVTTYGRVVKSVIEKQGPWAAANIVDGAIAPGMSGGPVWDAGGNVVGINVGVIKGSGLGFIVPGHVINALLGHS
jgi:S1-C subfamily serine protease